MVAQVGVAQLVGAEIGLAPGVLGISGMVVFLAYEAASFWWRLRRRQVYPHTRPGAVLATVLEALAIGISMLLFFLDVSLHQHVSAWYGILFGLGWAALVAWRFVVYTRRTGRPGA